jgi:hypothetical protein
MDSGMLAVEDVQRLEALARANRVRVARARLKHCIASGETSAAEAILVQRSETDTMPVGDLLTSQRNWGETRCRRLLMALSMHETKTIGSLTERQRRVLAARLGCLGAEP